MKWLLRNTTTGRFAKYGGGMGKTDWVEFPNNATAISNRAKEHCDIDRFGLQKWPRLGGDSCAEWWVMPNEEGLTNASR